MRSRPPLFLAVVCAALLCGGARAGEGVSAASDAEVKFLRRVLKEQGLALGLRPIQELDWSEIEGALTEAGASSVFGSRRLRAIALERDWKLAGEEKGMEYLTHVLEFMRQAARGRIPTALAESVGEVVLREEAGDHGRLRYGVAVCSLADTENFIRIMGRTAEKETPGWTMGADTAVYILKDSGVILEDIEYAQALLLGGRPEGLPLDLEIGDGLTLGQAISENVGFEEIESSVKAVPGTDRALRVEKTLRKPIGFWARRFVKDHTGSYVAYAMPLDGADRAYLLQLHAGTPPREEWEAGRPVPLVKGSFGWVVKNLDDRWAIFERDYYRGQDASHFQGKVWKKQCGGILEEKRNFIRLAAAVARLRAEGKLPPHPRGFGL